MRDEQIERLAEALAEHALLSNGKCSCGTLLDTRDVAMSFRAHLADALLAAIPTPAQVVGGLAEEVEQRVKAHLRKAERLDQQGMPSAAMCARRDAAADDATASWLRDRAAALGGRDA